jgi:hypothetical protein
VSKLILKAYGEDKPSNNPNPPNQHTNTLQFIDKFLLAKVSTYNFQHLAMLCDMCCSIQSNKKNEGSGLNSRLDAMGSPYHS